MITLPRMMHGEDGPNTARSSLAVMPAKKPNQSPGTKTEDEEGGVRVGYGQGKPKKKPESRNQREEALWF